VAATAPEPEDKAPSPARRRARRPAPARRRVASGVVWIAVVALLLAGVVAVNVAVLRLNLRMDDLNRERAQLRRDNEVLSSKLASATSAGRVEMLARQQLGLVPADPASTLYIDLSH
jgi:cell division protein FtsL